MNSNQPNMTTALVRADSVALQHTREEVEALKDTVKASNRDMTDAQFTVFMAAARHLGLDPLARQIVPIFKGGKMTVQTTIDGFRLIAKRTGKYRGQLGPFWCGKDGVWKEVWLEDGPPAAAKVGVICSDFDGPMWGVARFKSYVKGDTWTQMPDVMIAKVAESLALRKSFPAELSGVYTREEMMQSHANGEELEPLNIVDADVMNDARAAENDQLELAEWLREANFGTVAAVARFLAGALGHSRVKIAALKVGKADITTDEVSAVIAALAARREASTADDAFDMEAELANEVTEVASSFSKLPVLNGGPRP